MNTANESTDHAAARIIKATCAAAGVHVEDVEGASKLAPHIVARFVVCWLIRQRLGATYSELGRYVHRDHTSAMNACREVDAALGATTPTRKQVALSQLVEAAKRRLDAPTQIADEPRPVEIVRRQPVAAPKRERSRGRWTPADEDVLRTASSPEAAAASLGRTVVAVRLRAIELGIVVGGGREFKPRPRMPDPAAEAKGGPPPATRSGCSEIQRPCDRACRYRLDSQTESCALDVADRVALGDEVSQADVAEMLGVSRERVRQIEAEALEKLRQVGVAIYMGMVDDADQARVHLRILVTDV